MKLLHTLKTLLEQDLADPSLPLLTWQDKVFHSENYEDLWPMIKLFGGDIHELYNALDNIGKGEDFLTHLTYQWDMDRNS
mgnify:CR=1 FL=1